MYERTINLMRTINFQDKLFSRNFKRKVLLEIARQWGREVKPGSRANKQNADHTSRARDSDSENSASCSGPTAGNAALSASAPPSSRRGRAVHSANDKGMDGDGGKEEGGSRRETGEIDMWGERKGE